MKKKNITERFDVRDICYTECSMLESTWKQCCLWILMAQVVRKEVNAIHLISHYATDKCRIWRAWTTGNEFRLPNLYWFIWDWNPQLSHQIEFNQGLWEGSLLLILILDLVIKISCNLKFVAFFTSGLLFFLCRGPSSKPPLGNWRPPHKMCVYYSFILW